MERNQILPLADNLRSILAPACEEISDAQRAIIESALAWQLLPTGSEEEKDAAINLCWACQRYRWVIGEYVLPGAEPALAKLLFGRER